MNVHEIQWERSRKTWKRRPTLLQAGGEILANGNNADIIQLTVLLAFVALHTEPVLLILSKRERQMLEQLAGAMVEGFEEGRECGEVT